MTPNFTVYLKGGFWPAYLYAACAHPLTYTREKKPLRKQSSKPQVNRLMSKFDRPISAVQSCVDVLFLVPDLDLL
jgi:hypothetical protein